MAPHPTSTRRRVIMFTFASEELVNKYLLHKTDTNRNKTIIKMRESGLRYQKIGDIFGLSRQRVHQIIKKQHQKEK